MAVVKAPTDVLPESFATIEEAADWWSTHSAADDWDETRPVAVEVRLRSLRRPIEVEGDIAAALVAQARKDGVSVGTLVNTWLGEKLREHHPPT